ncbi:hypothetical protein Taro_007028, partial [Colocasia esculenta]|nr:hypothetical protein [Colocasia esculenta]
MDVQELLYQMFMRNHRFTHPSNEARSRSVWTATAQSNFKHLLYNARKKYTESLSESIPKPLVGARTDMDDELRPIKFSTGSHFQKIV